MQALSGRVRLEDVAGACGLDKATVSRALRGLASVRPATRERVCQAARNLGYRANPMASALAASRRRGVGATGAIPVAVVHLGETEAIHRQPNYASEVSQSVLRLAEALFAERGYRVEDYYAPDHVISEAAARMWYARGFQAVILNTHRAIPLNLGALDRLSLCSLNTEITPRPVHHVGWGMDSALIHAVQWAVGQGYRRLGLAVYVDPGHIWKEVLVLGLLQHQGVLKGAETSAYSWRRFEGGDQLYHACRKSFLEWIRAFGPDAVIANNDVVHWWVSEVPARRRPALIFSERTNAEEIASYPGYGPDIEMIAGELVGLIDRLVKVGDHGVPTHPLRIEIPPLWADGDGGKARSPGNSLLARARPGPRPAKKRRPRSGASDVVRR